MRAMRTSLLVGVLVIAGCAKAPAWSRVPEGRAGDGDATVAGPPLRVPRAKTPPKIDGALDDAAWAGAATLAAFVEPGGGALVPSSPVAAFARMTWDERNLYVGVVVHDRSPSSPFGRDDVDPHVWSKASGIELMLQPGDPGDNRDYYELQVDVNGAVWDTRFDDYNQPITGTGADKRFGHQDWQSGVERAVFVQRGGFYAVELALPWASLGPARVPVPPTPHAIWRLNLYAFRDGQRHAVAWSPLRGRGNFHRAERFGRIELGE